MTDERTIQRINRGMTARWQPEGESLNGFINQELTFERRTLKKILGLGARRHKTIKRMWEEEGGVLHYTVNEADLGDRVIQSRKTTNNKGRTEVFVTPHATNDYTMMTEEDLMEAMHFVGATGQKLENAKDVQGIRVADGYPRV